MSILKSDAPALLDIELSKKRFFRHSEACQHHPRSYGAWLNNRRPMILCNHEAIRYHFLEVDDPMKGRSGFEHRNNGGIEFVSPELNVQGNNTRYSRFCAQRFRRILSIRDFGCRRSIEQQCQKFLPFLTALESSKVVLINPPKSWCFYIYDLRPPSPESQPVSNQPICEIDVHAFRGSHNKCQKKNSSTDKII